MERKKFFIVTTVPKTLRFFRGQIQVLKRLFDVELISSPTNVLNEIAEQEDVDYHEIEIKRNISLFNDLRSLFELFQLFRVSKPYLVHGNTPKGGLLSMFASFLARVPKRIYCVHGLRYQGSEGIKGFILKTMERFTCFFATEIVTVSFGMKSTLKNDKITKKKVTVIGKGSINGINLETFSPDSYNSQEEREKQSISDDQFVYGFVGRLVRDKGINELIQAFEEINQIDKNTKLLLVGDYEENLDPLLPSTLEIIQNNPNVITVGFQSDIRAFLSMMDVFVFPSYREGFGVSLMEAGAMKLPVISSDISGCNEIVKHNFNGVLVKSRSKDALKEAMSAIKQDKDLRLKMIDNSRARIASLYDQTYLWKEIASHYEKFL